MNKIPKIFIGTLFCGEAEFDESCAKIYQQKDVDITHYIIKNKPEFEAHNELWATWNNQKHKFDLFIKVDADTILKSNDIFKRISETFSKDNRITGAQIPLIDFFTEKPILGLNCFTPQVIFNVAKDRLKPDRVDIGHDIVLRNEQVEHLAPAGYHCKYPHNKQSFHYLLHRTLKGQNHIISDTYNAWVKHNDECRMYALLGACVAKYFIDHKNFDYNDEKFNSIYKQCDVLSKEQKKHLIMEFIFKFGIKS